MWIESINKGKRRKRKREREITSREKKKEKRMVLDSAHLNSLSAPRISGVIRRYRGACSAKIQPVSRWVTPLKRNLRTGRVIFYDTFKSILRISTSCEGNEIHAELIAFVPCCFEPNDENNDTVLHISWKLRTFVQFSKIRTSEWSWKWKRATIGRLKNWPEI